MATVIDVDGLTAIAQHRQAYALKAVQEQYGLGTAESESSATSNTKGNVLSFHNLKYSITVKQNKTTIEKTILKSMSGTIGSPHGGEMMACMGQSGAGKTTLMNVLANRAGGRVEGSILYNGRCLTRTMIKNLIGYVHQSDDHHPELTVRETIEFVCGLARPQESDEERHARVNGLLSLLGLTHVADSEVGSAIGTVGNVRGISGGERKRLSIAEVMINKPGIIFLDEYTSGLDSHSAAKVSILLKDLAKQGHIIFATVHQPSSEIFFMFDRLTLVSEGRIVYLGKTADAIPHFDAIFPDNTCPLYSNPAEHIAKITHVSSHEPSERTELLVKHLNMTQEYVKTLADLDRMAACAEQESKSKAESRRASKQAELMMQEEHPEPSVWKQMSWLNWRNSRLLYRNKLKTKTKLMVTIFMALLLGMIYYDLPLTLSGVSDRSFFLLNMSILVGVRVSIETIRFFQKEKIVFMRHTEQGLHGPAAYVTSKVLIETPSFVILTLVFCAITLPMVGFQLGGANFLIYWLTLVLINFNAYGYGLFMGSVILNDDILAVMAPMIVFPIMVFSGLTAINIPIWLSWIEYIVYLKYGVLALFVTEMNGLEFLSNCKTNEDGEQSCTVTTGREIIEDYEMDFLSRSEALVILACLFSIMWFGAYWGLSQASRRKAN